MQYGFIVAANKRRNGKRTRNKSEDRAKSKMKAVGNDGTNAKDEVEWAGAIRWDAENEMLAVTAANALLSLVQPLRLHTQPLPTMLVSLSVWV